MPQFMITRQAGWEEDKKGTKEARVQNRKAVSIQRQHSAKTGNEKNKLHP
jgi:hypothetical protein